MGGKWFPWQSWGAINKKREEGLGNGDSGCCLWNSQKLFLFKTQLPWYQLPSFFKNLFYFFHHHSSLQCPLPFLTSLVLCILLKLSCFNFLCGLLLLCLSVSFGFLRMQLCLFLSLVTFISCIFSTSTPRFNAESPTLRHNEFLKMCQVVAHTTVRCILEGIGMCVWKKWL